VTPEHLTINFVYQHSTDSSKIRNFAVDINIYRSLPRDCACLKVSYQAFLRGVLAATVPFIILAQKAGDGSDPLNRIHSRHYHDHTSYDAPCYEIKYGLQ